MDKDQTGFILLTIGLDENDEPSADPDQMCQVIKAALPLIDSQGRIVEVQAVFNQGDGTYRPYGPAYV